MSFDSPRAVGLKSSGAFQESQILDKCADVRVSCIEKKKAYSEILGVRIDS